MRGLFSALLLRGLVTSKQPRVDFLFILLKVGLASLLIFVGLVTLKRSSRPPVGLDGFFSELFFRLIAIFVRVSVCFSVYC